MGKRRNPEREKKEMISVELKYLKKGNLFKRIVKGKPTNKVYVKDYYDAQLKAYWCYSYDDINDGRFIKSKTMVIIGFTF